MSTRVKLARLYGNEFTADGTLEKGTPPTQSASDLRRQKEIIIDQLRHEYELLKKSWGQDPEHSAWFTRKINNAQINSVATYYDLLPHFDRLLRENGGDLEKFYQAAEKLARLPKAKRREQLAETAKS